jgi:hypothetical protein
MAYHAIINQEYSISKVTGAEMITITALDIESRKESLSYIDASMENFVQWAEIITQPEKGFVVTGLKKKRNNGRYKHEILDADCQPVIVAEYPDVKKMERRLRQQWAKQDFAATPFGKLFEEDDKK